MAQTQGTQEHRAECPICGQIVRVERNKYTEHTALHGMQAGRRCGMGARQYRGASKRLPSMFDMAPGSTEGELYGNTPKWLWAEVAYDLAVNLVGEEDHNQAMTTLKRYVDIRRNS